MEEEKKKTIMGAIIGDIVGSRFEFLPTDQKDFIFYHPTNLSININNQLYIYLLC